jgi:hypothetical protein
MHRDDQGYRPIGFAGWLVVIAILLMGALAFTLSVHADPVRVRPLMRTTSDTLGRYVTRSQCNDEIIANLTLLAETAMDPKQLSEFRRLYPYEDSLARALDSKLLRRF